jgi:Putative stress-induced transcription regulator
MIITALSLCRGSMFIADSAGLDFLNSIASPAGTPVEWLSSGEDLLDWLRKAGLISSDVAAGWRKSALPDELDAAAGQARALREWFRGFVQAHKMTVRQYTEGVPDKTLVSPDGYSHGDRVGDTAVPGGGGCALRPR